MPRRSINLLVHPWNIRLYSRIRIHVVLFGLVGFIHQSSSHPFSLHSFHLMSSLTDWWMFKYSYSYMKMCLMGWQCTSINESNFIHNRIPSHGSHQRFDCTAMTCTEFVFLDTEWDTLIQKTYFVIEAMKTLVSTIFVLWFLYHCTCNHPTITNFVNLYVEHIKIVLKL